MTSAVEERLVELLAAATGILVFTGAGISTGSGIPDYRGPQGVWSTRRPVTFDRFLADPDERRRYWRLKTEDHEAWGRDARPNPAHRALVDLERAGKVLLVVTQNVDGLHRLAGTSPERLVEIHGTNAEVACVDCGFRAPAEPFYERFAATDEPPACECGGWLKPATISFGQALEPEDLSRSFEAAARCDLVVSIGSTLSVVPAADVPLAAYRRGVPYAVLNRGDTAHDALPGVLRLDGDVVELVPRLVGAALEGAEGPCRGGDGAR